MEKASGFREKADCCSHTRRIFLCAANAGNTYQSYIYIFACWLTAVIELNRNPFNMGGLTNTRSAFQIHLLHQY